MTERGQATVEYAGATLLVLALLLGIGAAARASLPRPATGDRAVLELAERHAPRFVPERGDDLRPVDFRLCRSSPCAGSGPAVLFVHAVRRDGFLYLQYWQYLPESRTARTGIPHLDGAHLDDWEAVIVKLRGDGTVVGARASAHLGWSGRHPWWELAAADWAPYPAPVYRAAGSHAGSFNRQGIDIAGDSWDGDGRPVAVELLPADEARTTGATFDADTSPPWEKDAWSNPETVITGRSGDTAGYARYARLWARFCAIC
ncbi:MAG: hypothetical protein QOJ13_1079 [Gaiellales bacterium]|jgi:hypothetical protein|nr:hypothetical protein [Gaiellales bacterium]